MSSEDDYAPGPVQRFQIGIGSCQFEAWVPKRKDGSFELLLDRSASELDCITIEQTTWLRQQAKGDNMVEITRLSGPSLDKSMKRQAEELLGQWLLQNLGVAWKSGTRAFWYEEESMF